MMLAEACRAFPQNCSEPVPDWVALVVLVWAFLLIAWCVWVMRS